MFRSVAVFLAWVVVGFIGSFALLYGFTLAGPAILLVVWAGFRFLPRIGGRRLPEAWGAVGGLGVFWLFVASRGAGEATLFATVGIVVVIAAIASYLVAGRLRCVGGPTSG